MRRFKLDLLSPYVSDVLAFAILGASVTIILGMAAMKGEMHQASIESVTSAVLTPL